VATSLLTPLPIGVRTAPNRVLFGPHVTNLGDDQRRFTDAHVAYYERRARGGAGIIVTEGASIHPLDWPYERAPLAARCGDGWRRIADACHAHGALVLASLDHAGGQGTSAFSQRELWAPSRVPEVNSREVPKWMEADDIAAVVEGFAEAATLAVASGCDGVEINAGQHSLVRQFLSGLTNHRGDEWGTDRLLFARQVLHAVRGAVGGDAIVSLRLCCDELAPWAGITPEMAPAIASALVHDGLDMVVVVRGSIYSAEKTRPDFHEAPGFNITTCRAVYDALPHTVVVLQGSLDAASAEWALAEQVCDATEITRGLIADPDLVAKVADGRHEQIRPCTRCNQACQVRDNRNPIVSCAVEPSSGHELTDPDWHSPAGRPRDIVVLGAGVAGLETARVAALRGHRVTVRETSSAPGGIAALTHMRPFVEWLVAEAARLGVVIETGVDADRSTTDAIAPGDTGAVVQATGGRPGVAEYRIVDGATVVDCVDAWRSVIAGTPHSDPTLDARLSASRVVMFDPIGGPIAVALAEALGDRAILLTHDQIAGNELSRTGDLAPANTRLAQRGVRVEKRTILREVHPGHVVVSDRFSGATREIACDVVVDCGFRLPTDPVAGAEHRVGDCVAPRTVLEAVLEGRRAALAL